MVLAKAPEEQRRRAVVRKRGSCIIVIWGFGSESWLWDGIDVDLGFQ